MKNYVLVSVFLVLIAFIVSGSTIQMVEEKPDLYKNMVDASVIVYNEHGGGSGVFIEDNIILTAAHVLEDSGDVFNIELNDGTILKSNNFYIDAEEDIGFIFVEAEESHIVKTSLLPIDLGDTVYLVSAPFNKFFAFTLTKGIVSHIDRDLLDMGWKDLLQVDAEGGPGSSGGPLYNSEGDLIGIYVGHAYNGGVGISLCESAESILEAYERCMSERNAE